MTVSHVSTHAAGVWPLLAGALIWCLTSLVLAFYRTGLKLIGAGLGLVGLAGCLLAEHLQVSFLLLVCGVAIYLVGHVLEKLRRM